MFFTVANINFYVMISTSKTTSSHYNLKILRPKVTKNIKNLHKKFCEFRPWYLFLRMFDTQLDQRA